MTEQTFPTPSEKNIFPNAITLLGQSPIFNAIEKGDLEMVQFYVSKGFNVNEDMGMVTPLTLAIAQNKPAIMDYLIKKGADVNKADKSGLKPIEIAIHYGYLDTVQTLLDHDADVNTPNKEGNLPLHLASQNAKIKIIDRIAPYTEDLNLLNNEDKTPLMITAENGYPTTTATLIQAGADVNKKNSKGQTALMFAAKGDNAYTLRLLVKQTLEIDTADNKGLTPLHYAAENNNTSAAQVLLTQGANPDKHAQRDGATPLILAIKKGHYDVVETLLNNNAHVNEPSKYGTPLDYIQGILMRPELAPEFERNTLHTQKLLKKAGAKTLETLEKEMKETLATPPCFAMPTPVAFQKPVAAFITTQNTLEKE